MKKIIVYDLNQTLYKKSSKDQFFLFLCSQEKRRFLYSFQMGWWYLVYGLKLVSKTYFKEKFYRYLNGFSPREVESYARKFWEREFPQNFRQDMIRDINLYTKNGIQVYIITGGYQIYSKYLENLLPVKVLGTLTNYKDGSYIIDGKSCNDEEKIRRLKEDINGEYELLEAYSDDDEAILYHANKGFVLKGGKRKQVQNKNTGK